MWFVGRKLEIQNITSLWKLLINWELFKVLCCSFKSCCIVEKSNSLKSISVEKCPFEVSYRISRFRLYSNFAYYGCLHLTIDWLTIICDTILINGGPLGFYNFPLLVFYLLLIYSFTSITSIWCALSYYSLTLWH